ncbi:MAG TPA: cation-transporting P-type ATPase [Mycobacteriales bacterium]|jgi:Ca2+-transporting ATPase|nr:cation-transporting P-type ATPase [Mycobacteriales bacterium]
MSTATLVPPVADAGLSTAEAQARLRDSGPNRVGHRVRTPLWRRVAAQLTDPLIVVLLTAIALTLATGDRTDAVIIALVVVVNTAVGVVQELRADSAIEALAALTGPTANVRRDGVVVTVSAEDVVPGDAVLLGEGDIVPADGQLVEAVRVLVDESALTGEAEPVEKSVLSAAAMSAGCVVMRGRGEMVVTATGCASALGRIAALVRERPPPTPLQKRLVELGRWLAAGAAALSIVVFAAGLARGQGLELMAVTAVSLVVAAVPESLPAVVTLALALGARRMAAHHAIVRRLPAVETLGSVTVVATDKTGTLTHGRMAVAALWTPARGLIDVADESASDEWEPSESALLRAAALCNDARLTPAQGPAHTWAGSGDPTETALLRTAARAGWHRELLEESAPRLAEWPFESSRRRMTTVHAQPGEPLAVTKGAPDVVLSESQLVDDAAVVVRAGDVAASMARDGFRVLAIAAGAIDTSVPDVDPDRLSLRLLGLVALADPVRATAAETVTAFRDAGIAPIVITGDDARTATAVARQAGLGTELGVELHARATPADKLRIVESLQHQGEVVAMTGDGVNDAPALRQADIGVAMGRRGTEAARQAADLVLADDELRTLILAIEEGRRAYDNVRRFLLFGLAGGVAELAVMVVGPFVGMTLPLLPAQILWINLLTHGLPGVAMGAEPADPSVLRRPPRPPREPVLGAGLWQRIAVCAAVTTAVTLCVGALLHHSHGEWRSATFLALGMAQLGVAAGVRARLFTTSNLLLPLAVAGSVGLLVAGIYVAPLQELLGTRALSLRELVGISSLAVVSYAVTRITARGAAPTGR